MERKIKYFGTVNQDGSLHINNREDFMNEVAQKFTGKDVEITICKKQNVRSTQQNRLWWLYMGMISKELGYSKDEMHDICKFKFLKREKVIERTGEIVEYLETTTRLTRTEFGEMVDKLISWAAEFKIELPQPNQQLEIH